MFPGEPIASRLPADQVKLTWSKRGWGKGQVSEKLTRGRHWYKLQAFFLLPHNYVSNVQRLDFVNQPPDELGNHIDRLEWEFSASFPAMYVQTIYSSVFATPGFCHTYSKADCAMWFFLALAIMCLNLFQQICKNSFNGNNTNENIVLYSPSPRNL